MNDKKKLIELFIYIAIVIVGEILLLTSKPKLPDTEYSNTETGGTAYATVLDE